MFLVEKFRMARITVSILVTGAGGASGLAMEGSR